MKRILSVIILFVLLFQAISCSVIANDIIDVYVNEKQLQFDVQPQMVRERLMVPMRAIFEALGTQVNWDNDNQIISAYNSVHSITAQIDSKKIYVDGAEKSIDVAPIIVEGRTMVPARFVAEALGCEVQWNNDSRTVNISTGVVMYATDGRSITVNKSEVETYQNVGWYTEPVVVMYAVDGRTLTVKKSEIEAYKNVGWYESVDEIKYAQNKGKQETLAYDKTKCGALTGTITYQYNKYIGTRPDVGAKLLLWQTNRLPTNDDKYNVGLMENSFNDPTLYSAEVDGMGNYYFDNIPAGKYYLFVKSQNTVEHPQTAEINKDLIEIYGEGHIAKDAIDFLKDTAGVYSFDFETIEIEPNKTVHYSHDWGNTYFQ